MLPALTVSGNRIVESATGRAVRLRGVNRSGLEYSLPAANAGITSADLDAMILDWRAQVIRFPLNQQSWLESPDYRDAVQEIVAATNARGAYAILDLQWLDLHTLHGGANHVPPLPDERSEEFWRGVASVFSAAPGVLYDILNEPHDTGISEWTPWALRLTAAIREVHPLALILVGGLNWGFDLSAYPLEGLEGVVYSTHVYRNKAETLEQFQYFFGRLSERYPVFAGEWGGEDGDLDWGAALAGYFDSLEIGWTAWSWSDWPHLRNPDGSPTPFGARVKSHLQNPVTEVSAP